MVAFNRPRQRNCRNPQRSLIHAWANSANRERCAYRNDTILEALTFCREGRRSIQRSYGRSFPNFSCCNHLRYRLLCLSACSTVTFGTFGTTEAEIEFGSSNPTPNSRSHRRASVVDFLRHFDRTHSRISFV